MADSARPNRWLHLRHPEGFDHDRFRLFEAHVAMLTAYAEALLAHWKTLPSKAHHTQPHYIFFPAELSADRRVATLPIGGDSTLGTRSRIEDLSSYMLWQFFPREFLHALEEGLTETTNAADGPVVHWRKPCDALILR